MEGLAKAGEICISGTVYDAIEAKLGLGSQFQNVLVNTILASKAEQCSLKIDQNMA
jgi:class 3 adenylate cyclase